MTESLTALQRETLRCVAEGRCQLALYRVGWRVIPMWLAYGRDASCQVKALHKRDLVRTRSSEGSVRLTVAGAFELFFDADEMLAPGNGVARP